MHSKPIVEPSVTDRGIEKILEYHDMRPQDFEGKVVADLGSGMSCIGTDLANIGVTASVINVDISLEGLQDPKDAHQITYGSPIQARLDHLPLPDESVDIAIATYSLPMWAQDIVMIKAFFSEAKRIVKPGGMISIYPLAVTRHHIGPKGDDMKWRNMKLEVDMEVGDMIHSDEWTSNPGQEHIKAVKN